MSFAGCPVVFSVAHRVDVGCCKVGKRRGCRVSGVQDVRCHVSQSMNSSGKHEL